MGIEFSPRAIVAFLVSLVVITALWSWIEPSRSVIQIVATLIGVEFVLMLSVVMRRPRAAISDGWHYLRPGFAVWVCLVGCGVATVFLGLVFVGTDWSRYGDRPDRWAVLAMILGFGTLALVFAVQIRASILRWDDEVIQERTALLQVRQLAWKDVVSGGISPVMRRVWLRGRDGTMVRASLDAHGIDDLVAHLWRRFPAP